MMRHQDYSHVILYAKNWYKKTDVKEDLRAILAHRCGMDLSDGELFSVMSGILAEHLISKTHLIDATVFDIVFNTGLNSHYGKTVEERFLNKTLSVLANLSRDDILSLEAPNKNILPLRHKDIMKNWYEMNPK